MVGIAVGVSPCFAALAAGQGGSPQSVNPEITSATFTAGSGGNPASIDLSVTYAGADTLTGCGITSTLATPPTKADIKAGTGTGTLEEFTWSESGGTLEITGLTSTSESATYLHFFIEEDTNGGSSNIETLGDGSSLGLDFTNPAFSSAATDTAGDTVTVTLSEGMYGTGATADWTVKIGGVSTSLSTVTVTGGSADVVIELASAAISNGDTVTVSYSGGDLEDDDSNPLGSITDQAVTNNVSGGFTRTYQGIAGSATNDGTTGQYTFSGATLGTGKVYVAVMVISDGTSVSFSGVTVGGSTPTLVATEAYSDTIHCRWYSIDSTSATGDIVVNLSGDAARGVVVAQYLVTGSHTVTVAATDTIYLTGNELTLNSNTTAGSALLVATATAFRALDVIVGFTQDGSVSVSSGSRIGQVGSAAELTAETPRTVTVGNSSQTIGGAGVALLIEAA